MIPAVAVKKFIEAVRDDHRWLKKLNHKQMDKLLDELDPPPKFWHKLGLHQKVGLYLGIKYRHFAFWFDMGCVDGDTEYLTPTGWKKIKDYTGGLVAQYEPTTREASFVEPTQYIDRACETMYHFKTARGLDQMLSPEHRMLVVGGGVKDSVKSHPSAWKHSPVAPTEEYQSKSFVDPWFYNVSAKEMFDIRKQRHVSVETTFALDAPGINLTLDQIRVQVAVHADGHIPNKSKVLVCVKKLRKKQRMRVLLQNAGIFFTERDAGGGYTSFRFTPPRLTKVYDNSWWNCSLEQKRVICNEVGHWDGTFSKSGGIGFFSRSKSCAEFIQFCFSSTGRRAYIASSISPKDGKTDYGVHVIGTGRTTNLANLVGGEAVPAPGGRKYCFEVPSHYLVLRRNGNIFVTGNTGKTLVSLELLQYWWDCGLLRRALVFVTSDKAFPTWERQTLQYKMTVPFVSLDASSSERKWEMLERSGGEGITFLTYPGTVAMVSRRIRSGKKKNKFSLDPELIDMLLQDVDAVIWDESTKCSNIHSLTYKICEKAAQQAEFRYALAGMPFGRDPTPLWPQMKLVDGGATLGATLGLFRSAFFTEKDSYWGGPYSKEYKFKSKLDGKLSKILQHRSLTYTAEECIDVPKVRHLLEEVRLPESTSEYYQQVIADVIEARGNMKAMKNAFLRMRQLSSGFMGLKDDETGERAEIEFEENPKLDRLIELIESLPKGRKALVFYEYTYSGRRIVEELKKLKHKPIWLWSGTKKPKEEMARFIEDPRATISVINNKVGAYSLDGLQVANYMFAYETALSVIDRSQSEKRIARQGQTRKCFIYDLICKNTVDERILDFHREGRDLFSALLANPKAILGVK